EKRLSLEREMACDEAVLEQTQNPRAYAQCLVSLAEKSFAQRGLAMAQALMSHAKETTLRLARILDASRPKSSRVLKPAFGLVIVLLACVVALPDVPRLIAFQDAERAPVIAPSKSGIISSQETAPQAP